MAFKDGWEIKSRKKCRKNEKGACLVSLIHENTEDIRHREYYISATVAHIFIYC